MATVTLRSRVAEWINISALISVALWGTTYVVVKIAVQNYLFPLSVAFSRSLLGALTLFLVLLFTEKDLKVARRDLPLLALLGIAGMTIFQIFFAEGLKYTTASNSSVVVGTSPIFVAIIVLLTRVDRLRWRTVFAIILAFAGVALVAQIGDMNFASGASRGDIFSLIAAVGWGIFGALQTPLFKRYSPLKITAYASAFGTLFMVPFAANDLVAQNWLAVPPQAWALLLYYGVASGFLATLLWSRAIRSWGPSKTSVYSYLNPVFGIISGVLILGEVLAPVQVVGMLGVFVGLVLARKK